MARSRWIKTDFWGSRDIARAGEGPATVLIGMWQIGDDHGIVPADAFPIWRQTVSCWGVSEDEVQARIDRLIELGIVHPYEAEGRPYWLIVGFCRQNPSIPSPSYRHPIPPGSYLTNSRTWANLDGRSPKPPEEIASSKPEEKRKRKADADTEGNRNGKRKEQKGAAGRILEWVQSNLDASPAKVNDACREDPALARLVQSYDGWQGVRRRFDEVGEIDATVEMGRRLIEVFQELRRERTAQGTIR